MNFEHSEKIRHAETEVQRQRERLECAFEQIEVKVRFGTQKIRLLNDRIGAPLSYVRENPVAAAVAFGLLGYAIGSQIQHQFGSHASSLDS